MKSQPEYINELIVINLVFNFMWLNLGKGNLKTMLAGHWLSPR